jgi:hypothetical protein
MRVANFVMPEHCRVLLDVRLLGSMCGGRSFTLFSWVGTLSQGGGIVCEFVRRWRASSECIRWCGEVGPRHVPGIYKPVLIKFPELLGTV